MIEASPHPLGNQLATISDKRLRAAAPGEWIVCDTRHGKGALVFRVTAAGARTFYFRQSLPRTPSDSASRDPGDKPRPRDMLPLGSYGAGGLSLDEARSKFNEYIRLVESGHGNVREYLERVAREREAAKAEEATLRRDYSLGALLERYVERLRAAGKTATARDVENIVKNHLREAFPDVVAMPARDVRATALRPALARLLEAGKGRTAGKLRSYVRAAYALAIRAPADPRASEAMLGFGVEANPADALPALTEEVRRGDRVLTATELRAYVAAVRALPESRARVRDALLLSLLLGGQRPTQLIRARPIDVDFDAGTLMLLDPKGRRREPRRHLLPLTKTTAAILRKRHDAHRDGASLFDAPDGSPMAVETLSHAVAEIRDGMIKRGEARAPFQLRDVRRTVETMLASAGVPKDVRAQLLSHGLGGVQQAHYDRHEYLDEKRAALVAWERRVLAKTSKPRTPAAKAPTRRPLRPVRDARPARPGRLVSKARGSSAA
jgi:integrase